MIWLCPGGRLEWRVRERKVQTVNPIIGLQTVDRAPNGVLVSVVPPEWVRGSMSLNGEFYTRPVWRRRLLSMCSAPQHCFVVRHNPGMEQRLRRMSFWLQAVVVVSNQSAKDIINNFESERTELCSYRPPTGRGVLRSWLLPRLVKNKHAFTAPP